MGVDIDGLITNMVDTIRRLESRVDELERQEIGSMQIAGAGGLTATVFPFGELNAESRSDDVSVQFQYPYYNTKFDLKSPVITGSATATVANGYLELVSTGTDAVEVESKNAIRYQPGHSGYAQFTASFVGSGVGYAGAYAVDDDGFFLKLDNGAPFIGYAKSGSETASGVTDGYLPGGEVPVSSIDWEKINIFRIMFGYLGVANPAWQIKLGGRWQLLGTLQTEGLRTATHVDNPVLPLGFKASGAMTIRTASWNGGKLGGGANEAAGSRFFEATLTGTLSGTNVLTLGTFRNRATFQGETNRVKAVLLRYHYFVDAPATGTGTVEFKIRKNATMSGTASWVDVDTNNSILETDKTRTYSSGGWSILTEWLGYSSSTAASGSKGGGEVSASADEFGLFLLPGEEAVITAQNVAGSTNVGVRAAYKWSELF